VQLNDPQMRQDHRSNFRQELNNERMVEEPLPRGCDPTRSDYENDYVAVWLDTFNDRRRAYVLLFNPLGVQSDALFTEGQGLDFSFDLVMQFKGMITADGYAIEVVVPFSSLRYEAGKEKIWGAHVLRLVSHLDEMDTWAPLRRESRDFRTATFTRFLEQGGQIIGIENVGAARSLELIPTITLSETGNRTRAIPRAAALANPSFPSRSRGSA
jgi:hypothetical protein